MTNQEAKTVQENIASIREVAMAMLQSSDSNMIELAEKLSDRCLDIEMELCDEDMLTYESNNSCKELFDQKLLEPEVAMGKVYNSTSNRIETIHKTHIASVPCYTFTFEEWREENRDAITEYIAEYPDDFTPDMTRYNMEIKLWIAGPGQTGIYNDDIVFRVELEEEVLLNNISEDEFRELLVVMEYEALAINHPKQYELASEEEQVEKWVDAMDKQDLQVEANKLGYKVI